MTKDRQLIMDRIDEADDILGQIYTVMEFAQARLAADSPVGDELPFAASVMALVARAVEDARVQLDIAADYAHTRS